MKGGTERARLPPPFLSARIVAYSPVDMTNVRWVLGTGLLSGLVACGTSSVTAPELLEATKTGEAFEGQQCSAIRPPTEPDLMAWDAGSRANLKSLQEQGVVGVRYKAEGCNVELEVLNCVGGDTKLNFSAYAATETKTAKSQRDLFAELPIGAARLGGKVGGGRALRTDYMLAGVLSTPVMKAFPADKLVGDCDRATHVVSKVYLGGFAMASGQSEVLSASASLFGIGAGGSQDRTAERLATEGSAEACEKAQKEGTREAGCSVPLRVGLTPIEGRAEGSCPTGSTWNGTDCVQKKVITELSCPAGTQLDGKTCVPTVSTSCPAGTHFVSGQGCVADVAASGPAASPTPAAPASGGCPAGMAKVSGGSFTMGKVGDFTLSEYCLDLTEVTVSAYAACVKSGKCSAEGIGTQFWSGEVQGKGACNWGVTGRDNHPMNCVDWGQAATFCSAQGKRLPTEQEWEWAARGGSEARAFPWGAAEPDFQACWSGVTKRTGTCAVGSFSAGNAKGGFQDLAGNVWEWTASKYDATARVGRGGSWGSGDPATACVRRFASGMSPRIGPAPSAFAAPGKRSFDSLFSFPLGNGCMAIDKAVAISWRVPVHAVGVV